MNTRLALTFALAALAAAAVPAGAAEQSIAFEFAPARIDSGGAVLTPGAGRTLAAAGGPALPAAVEVVRLPFGVRSVALEIEALESEPLELPRPLPIVPGRPLVSSGRLIVPDEPPLLLGAGGWYPAEWVRLELRGGLDPVTLEPAAWAVVRVHPLRTRLGGMAAEQLRSLSVRLTYEPPAATPRGRADGMLIVAPAEFEAALAPFAAARSTAGLATSVMTLETIVAAYPGRDPAEQVKYALAEAAGEGTAYALLAGDADQLPVRYTFHRSYGGETGWENTACDLYYSDLFRADGSFCDWDGNGNGLFGQGAAGGNPNPDDLDLLPDMLVGRIPASTPAELTAYLDKLLAYEAAVTGSEPWLNRVVLAGADTFGLESHGETSGIPEGEHTCEVIAGLFAPATEFTRLYETATYPRDAELTAATLAAAINSGCGWLNFANHGSEYGWHWNDQFMIEDVEALTNGGMLPMVFGYACSTASFDEENPENPGYPYLSGSLGESWLFHPNGGGLGYVGATRLGLAGGYAESGAEQAMGYLDVAFCEAAAHGMGIVGRTWAMAQWEFVTGLGIYDLADMITILESVLLGDPAASVGGLPETPRLAGVSMAIDDSSGDGDGCAEPGETISVNPVIVNLGAPSSGVGGLLTCLDPDVTVVSGTVDYGPLARGQSGAPAVAPVLTIAAGAATGRLVPLELQLDAGGVNGPLSYHFFDLALGDGPVLDLIDLRVSSDDNLDGRPGPGETVGFAPVIANRGCGAAAGLALAVTTDDPYVLDLHVPATYPDLAPGATACPQNGCTMRIDPLAPHGHEIGFEIGLSDGRATWDWVSSLTVVDRSMPTIDQVRFDPSPPQPGVPLTITARVRDGSGVSQVRLELESPDETAITAADMADDGAHGDGAAGDGIYGAVLNLPAGLRFYLIDVYAEDGSGFGGWLDNSRGLDASPFAPTSPVLLVADVPLDRYAGLAGQALLGAGRGFDLWSWFRGCPPAAILDQYVDGAVIWYCAHSFPLLDEDERAAIAHYLDAGGRLLVSEQDLGWSLAEQGSASERAWYETYLHATYVQDESGVDSVAGVAGDPIGDGLAFEIAGGSGAWNQGWPSAVDPIAPARTVLTYPGYSGAGSGSAAIAAAHGASGQLVYLAFGLEGIARAADRALLIERVLDSFGVPLGCGRPVLPLADSPGAWTSAELPVAESLGQAVFFPLDGMVYISGGLGSAAISSELLRLDPATGEASASGIELPSAVLAPRLVTLEDERGPAIFVFGGIGMTGNTSAAVYRVDPLAGTAERLTGDDWPEPMPFGGAAEALNGAYLFGGGEEMAGTATVATWVFDPRAPAGSRWTELAGATLSQARIHLAGGALGGKLYAIGGLRPVTGGFTLSDRAEVFDPRRPEQGWRRIADFPEPAYAIAHAFGIPSGANSPLAGTLVVAGGLNLVSGSGLEAFSYDPAADAWSRAWDGDIDRLLPAGALARTARGPVVWLAAGQDWATRQALENAEQRACGAFPGEPWIGIWTDRDTYRGGETMNVFLGLAEGFTPEPIDIYVLLEVAGLYYFVGADPAFPSFDVAPAALAAGAVLPDGFEWSGLILSIPFPDEPLPGVDATWYAAQLCSGTGDLRGGFGWQTVTLMP